VILEVKYLFPLIAVKNIKIIFSVEGMSPSPRAVLVSNLMISGIYPIQRRENLWQISRQVIQ